MEVSAVLKPFGQSPKGGGTCELQVSVIAETPRELKDCEAWCKPHRFHAKAIPLQDWVEPEAEPFNAQRKPSLELYDKAVEVMLLFDRPFCFSSFNADEFRYGFRLQLEPGVIVDALVDRLGRADHIDMVTASIEALLLEAEAQQLSATGRRQSQSCMADE
jgi:hypothetical protein